MSKNNSSTDLATADFKNELDRILAPTESAPTLTFAEALAQAQVEGGLTDGRAEIGGEYTIVNDEDKGRYVGVAMLILDYKFTPSPLGHQGRMVTVRAVTEQNELIVINDGSTGICAQCLMLEAAEKVRNIPVRSGLRVSNFEIDNITKQVVKKGTPEYAKASAAGALIPAHTYYLDGSKR